MSDEGYTHDPSVFDETDEYDRAGESEPADARDGIATDAQPAEERTFDWRGWALVGWLVVAFLVVPGYLYFYPRAGATLSLFGLGFRDTYLFLPLLPAILLGLLAVWATTRP